MSVRVLVVDDEKLIRWSLRERLVLEGYEVVEAEDGKTARAAFLNHSFDLALFDLRLPDADGVQLLKEVKEVQPDLPVIIVTAFSSVEGAVGAIKSGAADYITKPFDMDELAITAKRVLDASRMKRSLSAELREKSASFGLDNIAGESVAILEIKRLIRKVAQSNDTTVLLLGETGTGKDIAARAIHYESARAPHPFVNITCTAIPETLLESELFGHEAGAFTNAAGKKKGLFEVAHNGTVFMDEIGDMPLVLQAKLLRVLEEKSFKRIGGSVDLHIDIRIIAATHQNLEAMVQEQRFRSDLFYRLNIFPIELPALRDRGGDITGLAVHFLGLYRREFNKSVETLTSAALDKLNRYHWPGNVRELRNVLERAVLLSTGGHLGADDLELGRAALAHAAPDGEVVALPPGGCTLAEAETSLLRQALERCQWNLTHAGQLLGISRDQVRYKAEKFGLERQPDE